MSIIRPDQFNPPHKGNSQRASQGLGRFYMSAAGLNQGELPPGYTPMIKENYSSINLGSTQTGWRLSEVVSSPSFSGSKSAKISRDMAVGDPVTEAGDTGYGDRRGIPLVPLGNSVWQRVRMYIPSTFSWGYTYDGNDNPSDAFGGPTDGSAKSLKWLVFAPDVGFDRIYLNLDPPKRQVAQKASPAMRILLEANAFTNTINGFTVPTDQWVSFQLGMKVSNTGDGWARIWIDDVLKCEIINVDTVASDATGVNQWGIGDYWNGVPWSDGAAGRDAFYVDDIVVASDVSGYGKPDTVDAAGNPYISTNISVQDFI